MRRVGLALLLVIAACSSGPVRSEVVDSLAAEALVPLMEEAASRLSALATAVSDFCADPDAFALETAQMSWLDAETAWRRAEVATYFGPALMLRTVSKVDFRPVSPEGIDDLLASDVSVDPDYVGNRSAASRRGLGAIEYLIFSPLDQVGDGRRCELARSAAVVAAGAAQDMVDGWTGGTAPFLDTFTVTMDSNAALADVVGAQYEILHRQTLFELGAVLGVSAPEPTPQALPEGPAGTGIERYLAELSGIDSTLHAVGEASLIELIRSRSEEVADDIEASLESAVTALESVPGSMMQAIEDQPELMMGVLDDLSTLRDLIQVDVVSLLDLTLGFSDSDGDSG